MVNRNYWTSWNLKTGDSGINFVIIMIFLNFIFQWGIHNSLFLFVMFLFSWALSRFSLCFSLTRLCRLYFPFFLFILLRVLWNSCICGLTSFIIWKIWGHYHLKYFLCPIFCFSFPSETPYMYVTPFDIVS